MEDFRRHRAWCPLGQPVGRRRLDLDTDTGAFPVWEWVVLPASSRRPARHVHGNVGPGYLRLSADLAAALQSWADWQHQHQWSPESGDGGQPPPATDDDWRRWRQHGMDLAQRLAEETDAEVVYPVGPRADCPGCRPEPAGTAHADQPSDTP